MDRAHEQENIQTGGAQTQGSDVNERPAGGESQTSGAEASGEQVNERAAGGVWRAWAEEGAEAE